MSATDHTHECRRCGGDIDCGYTDAECRWEGDNIGCPNEAEEYAAEAGSGSLALLVSVPGLVAVLVFVAHLAGAVAAVSS